MFIEMSTLAPNNDEPKPGSLATGPGTDWDLDVVPSDDPVNGCQLLNECVKGVSHTL